MVVMIVAVRAAVGRVAGRTLDDMVVARAVVAVVAGVVGVERRSSTVARRRGGAKAHLDRAAVGRLLEVPG